METEQELTYTAGLPESHVEMGHHYSQSIPMPETANRHSLLFPLLD